MFHYSKKTKDRISTCLLSHHRARQPAAEDFLARRRRWVGITENPMYLLFLDPCTDFTSCDSSVVSKSFANEGLALRVP